MHGHYKCHLSYIHVVVVAVGFYVCSTVSVHGAHASFAVAASACLGLGWRGHYVLGLAVAAVRPFIVLSHLGVNNVMAAATCCQLGQPNATMRRTKKQQQHKWQLVSCISNGSICYCSCLLSLLFSLLLC